jgi:hypothetical protein
MPSISDFLGYHGSAGWPLYSYVLAGTGVLTGEVTKKEFTADDTWAFNMTKDSYKRWCDHLNLNDERLHSYDEFVEYFRNLRKSKGITD